MQTPQSRIDDLVARPSEGLPVEIKNWIDPTEPEGIAKIVRACLAMRNQNGGFLVIGFNDETLQVETASRPSNIRDTFHTDKIQQLISRFAHHGFEIEVAFGERDGTEIPVVVIPEGVQYPVASKSDLSGRDGKRLIRFGDIYCRTLNANGRVSSAIAQPKDWPDIFDRCFENREADIGRFLRRHLGASADGLSAFGLSAPLRAQTLSFLDEGFKHFGEAATARKLGFSVRIFDGAKFEAALVIDPLKTGQIPTATFRQTLASSNPNLTGWPIWLDTRGFGDESTRPVVRENAWETLINTPDRLDFHRIEPNGRFYLLRSLEDDSSTRVQAGTMLEPIFVILRVAETIAVGLSFARALNWKPEETTLGFAFRWNKLKGRNLYAWAHPGITVNAFEKSGTETVSSYVDVSLETPINAITPAVDAAVRQLFVQFGGYQIPMQSIENWTRKLIERRL
jgi:hypothetical protein